MSKIFFSYRPTDAKRIAERILERLLYNYGRDEVHTDIRRTAQEGLRSYIDDLLKSYSVLIAVIGPSWLDSRSRAGGRRLDDPADYIRLEIEVALERGIPILPILVRDAKMPEAGALPESMRLLANAQPLRFGSDDEFRGDMMKLHRMLAQKIVSHDVRERTATPIDAMPTQARKDHLNELAKGRLAAKKPPFQGVRIDTLGEVLWILGAQSGRLGALYGERKFPPDLSGADLSYLNLSGANLAGAQFSAAKLMQVDLSHANLSEAILTGADLTEANLGNARLDKATLRSANLQLANLSACSLEGADLSDVNLTTATLIGSVMNRANLQRVKLASIDLPGALLNGADLAGADLTDAVLPQAELVAAHLEDSRLDGADLSTAKLVDADLSRASLNKTDLSAADLTGAIVGSINELRRVMIDGATQFGKVKWGGKPVKEPRHIKDREQRLRAYRAAAQMYHDISDMLREGGFLAEASSYRLAEQRMRRGVLLSMGRYGEWLFSSLLNAISGYGERIGRTLVTYLSLVFGFALLYFAGTNYLGLGATHLTFYQSLIQSVVSFHGRGFVASSLQLGDPMAGVTVAESVAGLFVEFIFIATFSRRFLGD